MANTEDLKSSELKALKGSSPFSGISYYKKSCSCKGTASTNQFRIGASKCSEDGKLDITEIYYYPGPSCDICGKPWRQRKEDR